MSRKPGRTHLVPTFIRNLACASVVPLSAGGCIASSCLFGLAVQTFRCRDGGPAQTTPCDDAGIGDGGTPDAGLDGGTSNGHG